MFRHRRPPTRRGRVLPALVVALAVVLAGCTGATEEGDDPLRVGAWPSVEPLVLSHTIAELLLADGIDVEVREFSDAGAARQALELGDVELLPAYTGAAWLEVLERQNPPGDVRTSFARVREFDEQRGLVWLRPRFEDGRADSPPADATFAFFVLGPPAQQATLQTMSQLALRLSEDPEAQLCMDEDFSRRPDGRDAVFRAYGISLERQDLAASPGEAVLAVRNRTCLAGLSTTTDGAAWRSGLVPLIDDLSVFPAFVVAIVGRQSALARQGVTTALGPFSSQLTNELLAQHNAMVADTAGASTAGADLAATLRARAGLEAGTGDGADS